MINNKIKVRNLDPEVLGYFRNNSNKISYDDLDSTVVTDIKNNATSGANRYDDTELRNRIITLENDILTKEEADQAYATIANYDTSETVDSKIETAITNLDVEYQIDARINAFAENVFMKEEGAITEEYLSEDLIAKVNARYENRRPGTINEGGDDPSEPGGSSEVTKDEFNRLQTQVTENTEGLSNLQNYVGTNMLLKTEPITLGLLEASIQNVIKTARVKANPITINDLDEHLQDTLAGSSQSITDIVNVMYDESQSGQIPFSYYNWEADSYNVDFKYSFNNNIMVTIGEEYFEEAKEWAALNDIPYVSNTRDSVVYRYDQEASEWVDDSENGPLYDRISGCFVLSYPNKSLCFYQGQGSVYTVIDMTSVAKKEEVGEITALLSRIQDLEEKVEDFETRIAALESASAESGEEEIGQ